MHSSRKPNKVSKDDDDLKSFDGSDVENASTSTERDVGASGQEETQDKLDLTNKETTLVFRLRLLVFVILLLAAVGVSILVYFIIYKSETKEYKSQWDGTATKILESFLDIAETKFEAVSSLGVAIIAYGMDHNNSKWPFVTLSSFQQVWKFLYVAAAVVTTS